MRDFTFQNATKIIFGRTAMERLTDEILQYSDTILLLYGGGSVKATGLYDTVVDMLRSAGIKYVEMSGVKPNPRLSLVHEGIALCRKNKVGLILAVGGGSVIDSAKGIALGVPYEGDVWDFYSGKAVPKKKVPVATVCTLPAAGSEMSKSSVLTNEDGWFKRGVNSQLNTPEFSILNPELTYSLPAYQTACGCADILSHMMERYFTQVPDVDLMDRMLEAGMKTLINFAPVCLAAPDDYEARAQVMWVASLAHNGLLDTGRIGDWASHKIEHELSGIYDIAHGAGLAIVTPAWMRYVYKENVDRFVQFAVRVFDVDYSFDNRDRIAQEGINRLERFFRSMDLPVRLSEAGIGDDRFGEMAAKAVPTPDQAVGFFKKIQQEDIVNILALAK